MISTDAYARKVGLPQGEDVAYRFDREMPCEGTTQFADCFVREDQELLNQRGAQERKSVLSVHKFAVTGLDAVICDKYPIIHQDLGALLHPHASPMSEDFVIHHFVRDYMSDKERNHGKTLKDAAAAWNELRQSRGPRDYASSIALREVEDRCAETLKPLKRPT